MRRASPVASIVLGALYALLGYTLVVKVVLKLWRMPW